MSTNLSSIIPRLQNGDHLTRAEFERRYDAMPFLKKAELIDGVVFMGSPVRVDQHGEEHGLLAGIFGNYRMETPGVRMGDNSTVRLDKKNEPQPDLALFVRPDFGGQIRLVDGYMEGAPELVAEISASTVSIDLNKKLRAYQRHGVREYLVWRTEDSAIDWFVHDGQKFQRTEPDADGVVRSLAFPGLWVDVRSLLADDGPKTRATLEQGLTSPEHAAFIEKLQRIKDLHTPR